MFAILKIDYKFQVYCCKSGIARIARTNTDAIFKNFYPYSAFSFILQHTTNKMWFYELKNKYTDWHILVYIAQVLK